MQQSIRRIIERWAARGSRGAPLALGTLTFGTARWRLDASGSRAVFDAYVEGGGNFIDTADVYADGARETMVGRFIAERGLRDRIVLATKARSGRMRLAAAPSVFRRASRNSCAAS